MQTLELNLDIFVEELLKDLHYERDREMEELIQNRVNDIILSAMGMNLDPLLLDYLEYRFPNETNPDFLRLQAIANSPRIQEEILNELEAFRQEMLP